MRRPGPGHGRTPPGPGRLLDLDCPTTQVCYVSRLGTFDGTRLGDGQVVRTADGGRTWGPTALTGANLTDLACPTATSCLASSSYLPRLRRTASAGTGWVTVTPPPTPKTIYVTACGSTTSCLVNAILRDQTPAVWTTADLGTTWVQHAISYTGQNGDCNATLCVLDGDFLRGGVAVSTDGGASWSTAALPSVSRVLDLSCGSPTACAISAQDRFGPVVLSTTDAGATWHVRRLPPLLDQARMSTISCVRSTCSIAAEDGYGRPVLLTGPA